MSGTIWDSGRQVPTFRDSQAMGFHWVMGTTTVLRVIGGSNPYGKNYGGVTAGASLGYCNYRSKHFGYTLSLGFRFQRTKSEYPDVFFEGEQIKFAMTERLNLPMVQFGFGLMFR